MREGRCQFPGFKLVGKEDRKMTNGAPEDLIPSLAHEDPLVRSYTPPACWDWMLR